MEPSPTQDEASNPILPSAARAPRFWLTGRWRWIAAGLLLFLLLFALFLPTLLSSRFGRPILISYINQQLNGRAEIKNCSLGWRHGMQIDGLAIFDSNGRQILQVIRLNTGWTFPSSLRGRYNLGEVVAEGMDVLISREPDGSLNWDHVGRPDSNWAHIGPSVTGDFTIRQASATYEDRFDPEQPPVYFRSVDGTVSLQRGSLADKLAASVQIGSVTSGRAELNGWLSSATERVKQILTTHHIDNNVVGRRLGSGWTLLRTTKDGAVFRFDSSKRRPTTSAVPASTQPAG